MVEPTRPMTAMNKIPFDNLWSTQNVIGNAFPKSDK